MKAKAGLLALVLLMPLASPGAPQLVKDINPAVSLATRDIPPVTMAGGKAFFSAWDADSGTELWISDGTPKGTRLLKDLYPGLGSSAPARMREMGGKLFFTADDGVHGVELWCSDGTADGTILFADLSEGSSSEPQLVAASATHLWLTVSGGEGMSLWCTDGTAGAMVELNSQGVSGRRFTTPEHFALMGGRLFFAASGSELWRSDGTPEGTVKVEQAQIEFGSLPRIKEVAAGADRLYFTVANGDSPRWLWRTDGDPGSAVLIPRTPAETWWVDLQQIIPVGEKLFFFGRDNSATSGDWRAGDGTAAGSVVFTQATVSRWSAETAVFGDRIYFAGYKGTDGVELWRSDATLGGTFPVKDIAKGYRGSDAGNLCVAGRWLYFTANDGKKGPELWRTDGTAKGTRLVAETLSGKEGLRPGQMTADGEAVYFIESSPGSFGNLWRSDGTKRGTVRLTSPEVTGSPSITWLPRDIFPQPSRMVSTGERIFFQANDGRSGAELWSSDGTAKGTRLAQDIRIGDDESSPEHLTRLGSTALFVVVSPGDLKQVWVTDGKRTGTKQLTNFTAAGWGAKPADFTVAGSRCFFTSGQVVNNVLWVTDGTAKGTREIHDANGNPLKVTPGTLVAHGTDLYFVVETHPSGRTVWRSDGTDGGTVRVKEVFAATDQGNTLVYGLESLGSSVCFISTLSEETKLWVTDGTGTGTHQVPVEAFLEDYFDVYETVPFGDRFLFLAQSLSMGTRWWITDGTTDGTRILKDIQVGTGTSGHGRNPLPSAMLNGTLYLVIDDQFSGPELWRTDGTANGTSLVKDIRPGSAGPGLDELTVAGGRIYFTADDGTHGRELWSTDGTEAGTLMVGETLPGPPSSNPSMLTVVRGRLCFAAESPEAGYELHSLELPAVAAPATAGLAAMLAGTSTKPEEGSNALLRRAFNLPPGDGGRPTLIPSTGTAGFPGFQKSGAVFRVEYLRRKDGSLTYVPKYSVSLDPASFQPMSGTEFIVDIDEVWERVTIEQHIDPAATRMFGVVEVTVR